MSGPSPSMVIRLAVTLGATTLLTIGAVGVGAATSDDGKKDAADESSPSRKGDKPITSVTPTEAADTDQGDADDSTTKTTAPESPSTATPTQPASGEPNPTLNPAATCLEELNKNPDTEQFQYFAIQTSRPSVFAARPKDNISQPTLPSSCTQWVEDDDPEVRFVFKGVKAPTSNPDEPLEVGYFPGDNDGTNDGTYFMLSEEPFSSTSGQPFNKADVSFCSEKKLCSG